MAEQITDAFVKISELAQALGVEKINELPGCWYRRLDEHWEIAVNGHREELEVEPDGTMGAKVPPFHAAVWFNGWLAGIFSPNGGVIAAGEIANEEAFMAVLEKAIEEVPDGT